MHALSDLDYLTKLRDWNPPQWFLNAMSTNRKAGTVQVDGCDISYFQWGNPNKPGVVLTHGFMAHSRCWAFVAPLLAHKYHLVAFDLSGMGDSGWRTDYSFDSRAREAVLVAEHAGMLASARRPSLICHSYGGSVGMAAVEQNDGVFDNLIICDLMMVKPGDTHHQDRHEKRKKRGVRPHRVYETIEAARKRFRLAPEQPCSNDYLVDYLAFHSIKRSQDGWVWKFDPSILADDTERSADWWTGLASRFANLAIPKAFIYGQHSQLFGDEVANYLESLAPQPFPIVRVPNAYHHIMLDEPIALAASLDSLLQSLHSNE